MPSERMFIHTKFFDKQWASLGCDDDDLTALQDAIRADPQRYPVIRGTGGVRKIRVSTKGRGKSGGARALYVDIHEFNVIYMVFAYSKSEKDDINDDERKYLKMIAERVNEEWRKRK